MSHLTDWKCSLCTGPVKYGGRRGDQFVGTCMNLNCNNTCTTPVDVGNRPYMNPTEVLAVARSIDIDATVMVTHDETIVRCRSVYAELVRDAIEVQLGQKPRLPEYDRVEISYNVRIDF